MNEYPNPCDICTVRNCTTKCLRWRTRYLFRQKQINAYAKKNGIMPDAPVYKDGQNPCEGCKWAETCDSICVARAQYWDDCMRKIREVAEHGDTVA